MFRIARDTIAADALTCKKIETGLGWKPTVSLDDGLRQTIEWYRNNQTWLDDVRAGEYRSYYEKYYENLAILFTPLLDRSSNV